jgi:hypothetical protein
VQFRFDNNYFHFICRYFCSFVMFNGFETNEALRKSLDARASQSRLKFS